MFINVGCRSLFPKLERAFSEQRSNQQPSSEVIGRAESATNVITVDEETLFTDITDQDDQTMACITEEWKQLVVNEDPKLYSPSCMSKDKLDQTSASPRDGNRQLDRETSRILERLEIPRPSKAKTASPVTNESCMKNIVLPTKKPLIPFQPTQSSEQVFVGSQLMKPKFQRQKRKQRWNEGYSKCFTKTTLKRSIRSVYFFTLFYYAARDSSKKRQWINETCFSRRHLSEVMKVHSASMTFP